MSRRLRRHVRLAQELQRRNPHTVPTWGWWGILGPLRRGSIWPLPLTRNTYWMRRSEWRIFHISDYDLVD